MNWDKKREMHKRSIEIINARQDYELILDALALLVGDFKGGEFPHISDEVELLQEIKETERKIDRLEALYTITNEF